MIISEFSPNSVNMNRMKGSRHLLEPHITGDNLIDFILRRKHTEHLPQWSGKREKQERIERKREREEKVKRGVEKREIRQE